MSTKHTEALKLALVQKITDYLSGGGLFNPELADHIEVRDLLIDCREALAEQPAQQINPETRTKDGLKHSPNYVAGYNDGLKAAQQHIEHCIWARNGHQPCPHVQPAQPSKPWVGLTDEELDDLWVLHHDHLGQPKTSAQNGWAFERAIEAKLKDKNK